MARQTSSEWEAEMADEGKLARLEAEIERLREGLQWYADKANYATGQDCPDVLIDGGDLARRTLEQSVGKFTESTLPQTDVCEWFKKNI